MPYHDGLRAPKFFFDKGPIEEPSTTVFLRLALTLNNFTFAGEHYQQFSGLALGTETVPNYNLFVGFAGKISLKSTLIPYPITLEGT